MNQSFSKLCLGFIVFICASSVSRIHAQQKPEDDTGLSIRASALAHDTVLVSVQTAEAENIDGLELAYSTGITVSDTWKNIPMYRKGLDVIKRGLRPETTYFFKAKGSLKGYLKEVFTYVKTPPAVIPSITLKAEKTLNGSLWVDWSQDFYEDIKGYKFTLEKEEDGKYSVEAQATINQRSMYLNLNMFQPDTMYRIIVTPFSLSGLWKPSNPVYYPEIPETTTASPVTCPTTKATLSDPDPETISSTIALDLRVIKQTATRLQITWFLRNGDVSKVKKFQIIMTTSSGRKLINAKVKGNQRFIVLRPVSGGRGYSVTVKALDIQGNIMGENQVVLPSETSEPEMIVEVNEIQNNRARLIWNLRNVEKGTVKEIRMAVLKDGPDGDELVNQIVSGDTRLITIQNLQANSVYLITVDAKDQDGEAFLSSVLTLNTPASGDFGLPVIGTSKPSKQSKL